MAVLANTASTPRREPFAASAAMGEALTRFLTAWQASQNAQQAWEQSQLCDGKLSRSALIEKFNEAALRADEAYAEIAKLPILTPGDAGAKVRAVTTYGCSNAAFCSLFP